MYKVFPRNLYSTDCHITPQHKRAPKTSDTAKEYPEYSNGDLHTQTPPPPLQNDYYRPGTQPHTNKPKNYLQKPHLLHQ